MRTYLIRHGEAVGNAEHRFIGQDDVALSSLGRRQADDVTRRLAGASITHIVSSDLGRCVDTARPLAEHLDLDIRLDPRLREISNGQWSGLLPAEIADRWPELWSRYRSGEDVPRPEGERWVDVRARSLQALSDIRALGEDAVVAVFTHGGPLVLLAMEALGLRSEGSVFAGPLGPAVNAAITSIRWSERGGTVDVFNAADHLGRLPVAGEHPLATFP